MEDLKSLLPGTTLQSLTPGSPQLYSTKESLEYRLRVRSMSHYKGKALKRFDS